MERTQDFRGKRVTVMGLGSFGGGIGAVQFLVGQGATVTLTDLKSAEELTGSLRQIENTPPARLHLGGHREQDFRDTDIIVASPAVPKHDRYLQIARDAGIPITCEFSLFWERNPGKAICVTGSNGKSTTAALIHALLSAACGAPRSALSGSTVWLGGNIGHSLLPQVHQIRSDDWVVLEVSSFQLEDLAPLTPNPHVAVVTNFSPNHLDRHGTVEAYRAAKQNLLRWQTPDRVAVLNQNDTEINHWKTAARTYWFGRDDEGRQGLFGVGFESYKRRALLRCGPREQVLPLGNWLNLPGVHNFQNALAATCTALVLGAEVSAVESGLSGFYGLPHRLQLVAEVAGRKFYNDSKATTPEAALLAADAFRDPVVLLAGGYDKDLDLTGLAQGIVSRKVKAVSLMGQTAERLKQLIRDADPQREVATKTHVTFDTAFAWAAAQSAPGDVVLLSPGCASYDWFPNYEVRGDEFTKLARNWSGA